MKALFRYELKSGLRNLLIWALAVGGLSFICILLYQSMENSIADMAESFADMGAFSNAFGMSALSIATFKGYFATEVGTVHALGGSMFAAIISIAILSKEENDHTAEFTYTLPIERWKIVGIKYVAVLTQIFVFSFICFLWYQIGFWILKEQGIDEDLVHYMIMQMLMNIEIASICFIISSISKKNKIGLGISVALIFYTYDLMARIVPDLEKIHFVTPFYYSNATEIFLNKDASHAVLFGIIVIGFSLAISAMIYLKKDLAS